MRPLAYHITWGTYGTRLHGDPRGTVDRTETTFGSPIIEFDQERWEEMKSNLKFPPRRLTAEQMAYVEHEVPRLCAQGSWSYLQCAAGPDHVHTLLTSSHDPATLRRMLKRWLGQSLSSQWPTAPGQSWWSEGGSIRWVGNEPICKPRPITSADSVRARRLWDDPSLNGPTLTVLGSYSSHHRQDNDRRSRNLPLPGLLLARQRDPIRPIIDDLLLIWLNSDIEEWHGAIWFLPL